MHQGSANDDQSQTTASLIICGMHRSGTSFLASLLANGGLHLGDELLGASSGNPLGHFEDLDILTFHQNVLMANGLLSEGYTTQREIIVPQALRSEAETLLASRARSSRPWGWKEPRTTLFLDFWRELLPTARFLFVFRRPWEVVDSLLRRNEATFHWNPAFAIDVWTHYNERLLSFIEHHPGETHICELTQVATRPGALFDSLRNRFGLPLSAPSARYQPALMRQDVSSSQPALLMAACPRAYDLYLRLRDQAGSDSPLPRVSETGGDSVDLHHHVFTAWSQATQHMLRCHEAEQRLGARQGPTTQSTRSWHQWLFRGRHRTKAA